MDNSTTPSPLKSDNQFLTKRNIIILAGLILFIIPILFVLFYFILQSFIAQQNKTNYPYYLSPTLAQTPEQPTPTQIVTPLLTTTVTNTPTLTPTARPTSRPAAKSPTPTPTITPTPQFAVTSVNVIPDYYCQQTDGAGGYPFTLTFYFTGTITVNGPGTVTYKWQPDPPYITTTQTLNFNSAGSKIVTSTVTLTIPNWQVDYAYGSNYLKVYTPNTINSNVVNVKLNNNRNNVHPCP